MNRRRRHSLHEVETSPDGRYIRFDEKLGSGAYKDVYLCYDTETGQEVAWNTVYLGGLPSDEQERIRGETGILKSLSHPAIIGFGNTWESADRETINFTTEIVTSGTLKQYINRVKGIKLKVIKAWCRQILHALHYLHHLAPPIIHRDLKCDNIFVNGSTGEVRLGDFGLARARHSTHVESVLGTPEFIAPELYEQMYTESVDVYAFGMCMLEMITKEYPFQECSNAAQIWRKVSAGIKPQVLQRIEWEDVRLFIEICLASSDMRPSTGELLQHPFLAYTSSNPGRDDRVCPVREKGEEMVNLAGVRQADKQIPQLPVERMATSPGVQATLQNAGAHASQTRLMASPLIGPGPTPSAAPGLNRQPSPSDSQPTHYGAPSSRHSSLDREAAYSGLSLNTAASSSNLYNPSPTPSHAPTPISSSSSSSTGMPRTSGTARPPMISTQPHHPLAPSPAATTRSAAPSPPQSHSVTPQFSTPLSITCQSPSAANQSSVSPTPLPPPVSVNSVIVDVESVSGPTAHVVLHIGLDHRRKKQISFEFDFRTDTSPFVAGEMVRTLKLPDGAKTEMLIAVELESKLDPFRKKYFDTHRATAGTSGGAGAGQGGQGTGQTRGSQGHPQFHVQPPQPPTVPSPPPQLPRPLSFGHSSPSSPALMQGALAHAPQLAPQSALHASQTQPPPATSAVPSMLRQGSAPRVPGLQHTTSLPSPQPPATTPPSVPRRSTMPSQLSIPSVNAVPAAAKDGWPKSPTIYQPTAGSGTHSPPTPQSTTTLHLRPNPHPPQHVHSQSHSPPAAAHQLPPIPSTPPSPLTGSAPPASSSLTAPQPASYGIHSSVSQPSLRLEGAHLGVPSSAPQSSTPPGSSSTSFFATAAAFIGAPLPQPQQPMCHQRRNSDQWEERAASANSSSSRRNSATNLTIPSPQSPFSNQPRPSLHDDDLPPSPMRRAQSDAAVHNNNNNSHPPPSPPRTAESMYKQLSILSVSQLKDRIRAKGAAHRLADCIEKKDLIECLMSLTPPSAPLGESPTRSGCNSRQGSRPSSPEMHLKELHLIGGGAATRERKEQDPFADLFSKLNGSLGVGRHHETPSPLSASPRQLSPLQSSPDPLSPRIQRPASIPVVARATHSRQSSQPLIPSSPSRPVSVSPSSFASSILPTDPFAHLDAAQLSSSTAADMVDWREYFIVHDADKDPAPVDKKKQSNAVDTAMRSLTGDFQKHF